MAHNNFLSAYDYLPKEDDVFLVDTNVLISLFTPINGRDEMIGRQYEKFIRKADAKSKFVVTSMNLSELINVNLRYEYDRYRANGNDIKYKEYRKLQEFEKELELLKSVIERQLLKMMERINDDFTNIDVVNCFSGQTDCFDFADRYYVELARKNCMKILTNDYDFSVISDVYIVSTNPKFFGHT